MRKPMAQWIKRISIGALIVFFILATVLAVHIYDVTHRPKGGVDSWQLARIDMLEHMDSAQVDALRISLHQIPGIKHSYYNFQDNILVYAFDPLEQSSAHVYEVLATETCMKGHPFKLQSAGEIRGCPIVNKSSISYRISIGFQKLFEYFN